MDAAQLQQTNKFLDNACDVLSDDRILFLLALYAVGMGLKVIKSFPTRLIPATLTLIGPALGAYILSDLGIKQGALLGLGLAVICVYFNQLLVQTFPNNALVKVLAGELNFQVKSEPQTPPNP